MLRIIIDTNILFSAILNKKSRMSLILLNSKNIFQFYIPKFALRELSSHKIKIMQLSKYTESQFKNLLNLYLENMIIIDENNISDKHYKEAYNLCQEIDLDDLFFVAFAIKLNLTLWTGDKKLINGLKSKGFNKIIDTTEMYNIYDKKN